MPVPTSITDCNATAANNSPAGSDSIGTSLDDYLRAHAAIIRQVSDDTLHLSGGTVTGQIKGITPVAAADLARKDYVDTMLPKAGGTVTGQIKGITPVAAEDLARKDYVDAQLGGSGPAFYADGGGTATANGTYTVQLITQVLDTNSAYDPTTGIFNPQVSGYYSVSISASFNAASVVATHSIQLYKNNSFYSGQSQPTVLTYPSSMSISTLVYLNGTSDYLTTKYYQTTGGSITPNSWQFSACLVRS